MIFSLKYRIALVIFVLELLMVSLVLWQTQSNSFKSIKAQIKEQHAITIFLLKDVSRFALINDDYGDLQIYFENLKNNPYAIEIAVSNHKEMIVASSNPLHIGIPTSKLPLLKNQHSHSVKLENRAVLD
ncbi:MAG: hypothetical protein PF503_21200 [Desulfobacula sp.]|jgi:hypothetical protein|nr:hypothetical protein [Desulfobacula sp.]